MSSARALVATTTLTIWAPAAQFYDSSAYAPSAPPEGSKLRQVLTTVSLGAMSQGKWACAERCLRAAGETLLLMLLHALQHNRAALQVAVAGTSAASAMHTLAMLLLVADARIGLRSMLQKDWHISRCVRVGSFALRSRCPALPFPSIVPCLTSFLSCLVCRVAELPPQGARWSRMQRYARHRRERVDVLR